MKIIVLKGNNIISEFTSIIYYELSKFYEVEYTEVYNEKTDKDILHFLISPQKDILIPKRYILYNT